VRPQPLIAVRDVEASAEWYATLLGAERLGGDTHDNLYDRVYSDGELILQLHAWDEENHPNLVGVGASKHGHGVLLWFEVDNFDEIVDHARSLDAQIVEEPHVNPGPKHREIWMRDPDGYMVVVASPDGEAAE
jgi:catechol 2,3-dioxygenase-like lactoylglutathione lyase family enzyme